MDTTESDLQHLLELLALLPAVDARHAGAWYRLAAELGHRDLQVIGEKLSYIDHVLSDLAHGDIAKASADGGVLAGNVLQIFGGDARGPMAKGKALEILSGWFGNGIPATGRLWLEDLVAVAWRVYRTNPPPGHLTDERLIAEKWRGWSHGGWSVRLRGI